MSGVDGLSNCSSVSDLLKARQGYPLEAKINLTKLRIQEWYEHFDGKVFVSFSGVHPDRLQLI